MTDFIQNLGLIFDVHFCKNRLCNYITFCIIFNFNRVFPLSELFLDVTLFECPSDMYAMPVIVVAGMVFNYDLRARKAYQSFPTASYVSCTHFALKKCSSTFLLTPTAMSFFYVRLISFQNVS